MLSPPNALETHPFGAPREECITMWNSQSSTRGPPSFNSKDIFLTRDMLEPAVHGAPGGQYAANLKTKATSTQRFYEPKNDSFVRSQGNRGDKLSREQSESREAVQSRGDHSENFSRERFQAQPGSLQGVHSENLLTEQFQSKADPGSCRRVGLRRARHGGGASVLHSISINRDTDTSQRSSFRPPTNPEFSAGAVLGKVRFSVHCWIPWSQRFSFAAKREVRSEGKKRREKTSDCGRCESHSCYDRCQLHITRSIKKQQITTHLSVSKGQSEYAIR